MASIALKNKAFPVGASIGAYLLTQKAPYVNAAPTGSAVTTATVDATGVVTFTGLAENTRYTAYYTPGGSDFRYVDFTTPSDARTEQGAGDHVEAISDARERLWLPGGVVAQNMERYLASDNVAAAASGTLLMAGRLVLPKGRPTSKITVISGTMAGATLTHQRFGYYRAVDRVKLAETADDTSTAWGADTAKELALTAPYTPGEDVAVYVGILVTATTPPSYSGRNVKSTAISGLYTNPKLGASSDTGLDGTSLPATAAALTALVGTAYVAVR